MATTLSVEQVRAQMSAEDKKLYRLWRALPADRAVSEEEAFEILEQEAGRPGDDAWASAMLITMRTLGIVDGSGRRAETFPELPEDHANRHGTDVFNAALERQQAEERRQREKADQAAQRAYENGPEMRERGELIALMREVVHEEIDPDRLVLLEAQFRQLRTRVEGLEQHLFGNHIAA